jgi:hypothetical protein
MILAGIKLSSFADSSSETDENALQSWKSVIAGIAAHLKCGNNTASTNRSGIILAQTLFQQGG